MLRYGYGRRVIIKETNKTANECGVKVAAGGQGDIQVEKGWYQREIFHQM